jgi:multidrug resistance efflux pump
MNKNRSPHHIETVLPTPRRRATIHLVQSSRLARRTAKALLYGLVLSVLAMAFLPWQQTSRGSGEVVAFAPQERQQTIQATAKGIVAKIADGLLEGKKVKKGDFLLEIQPFAGDMVEQLEGQRLQLKTKEETAKVKSEAYAQNVTGFTEARDFAIAAAKEMISSTKSKLQSKQKQVSAYKAKELQARLNYERQRGLWQQGLKPQKEVEKLKKEWDVAQADLESVKRDVTALEQEVQSKQSELQEKQRVAQTKIDYAIAMQQGALGEIATVRKELGDLQIKIKEMERLTISAPRDGTVFRLNVNERGDTVKEGDSLLTIVPEATQKAVELYLKGNDIGFVQPGQEVRLQFEGWPSVQVPGWPSVAIGTFDGTVSTIDATDNGKGEFRVLVTPDETEQKWPIDSNRFLRQGVRTNGWVVLGQVSLGYEVWRQMNGFPVMTAMEESKQKPSKPSKPPKVPK